MESTKVSFVAGVEGEWEIVRIAPVRGNDLGAATRLARLEGSEFMHPCTIGKLGTRRRQK